MEDLNSDNPFFEEDEEPNRAEMKQHESAHKGLPGSRGLPAKPVGHVSSGALPVPEEVKRLPSKPSSVPRNPAELRSQGKHLKDPDETHGLVKHQSELEKTVDALLAEFGDDPVLGASIEPVSTVDLSPEVEGEDAFEDNDGAATGSDSIESFFGLSEDDDEDSEDENVDGELEELDASEFTSEDDDYFSKLMSSGGYEGEEEEDFFQGFDLDEILSDAVEAGASDVHVNADDTVSFSILGDIVRREGYTTPTGNIIMRAQQAITSAVLDQAFTEELELDTSYVIRKGKHKGRRLRLNIGRSFGDIMMTFRVVADVVPPPAELGVPKEMEQWSLLPSGLFLLNGATGSGKTTTIASLLKQIQLTRAQKIITLEKPIEFVYGNEGKALVVQREVGKDCRSFASGLKSAMRSAPNVILVGEVRDQEEVNELLRAAETGHLAISTIHADSVVISINRIRSMYEGDDQKRVLASLGDMTRGLANQVLMKSADGKSRFALHEVLTVTPQIGEWIAAGDTKSIRQYQLDKGITMEHALTKAAKEGRCKVEDARAKSPYPYLFDELMRE